MPDNVGVLSLMNDPYLIGESGALEEQPQGQPSIQEHYTNLLDFVTDDEIKDRVTDVQEEVEKDIESHEPSIKLCAEMIPEMGFDRSADVKDNPSPGSTGVTDPILAKANVDLTARFMGQFWSSNGNVKTDVVGQPTPIKEAKAKRVKEFHNLQQRYLIPGYYDHDKMLFTHLPRVGTGFKKVFWNGKSIQSIYVPRTDLIVPYHSESIETAERITHLIKMPWHEMQRFQKSGFFLTVDLSDGEPDHNQVDAASDKIQGTRPPSYDKDIYELCETHCILDLPESGDEGPLPYVLTYEKSSGKLLRLARNWDIEDDTKTRDETFVPYTMMSWRGIYGLGLSHQIGGLAKTATSALRALVDAGMKQTVFYGVRLKGPTMGSSGQDIKLNPDEIADIDVSGINGITDVRQAFQQVQFGGPNQTLLELLLHLEEKAQEFCNTNMEAVSEMTNTGPVGSTLALLDESSKVFNFFFSGLHNSRKKELKLIHRLNYRHLNDQETVQMTGGELIVSRMDFDDEIDILPISDPNCPSLAQKVAKWEVAFELLTKIPNANLAKAAIDGAADLGMPEFEEYLPPMPPAATAKDPVGNIQAILNNEPVQAFPNQTMDADDHIAVYLTALQSPILGDNPFVGKVLNGPLLQLILGFIRLRIGTMFGHAISGDPSQSVPVGIAAPPMMPQEQSSLAKRQAQEAGSVLATDTLLSQKMLPIIQKAMQYVPTPPSDPLQISAQAEAAKAASDAKRDAMQVVLDAADIQSKERIAEMNANQATDRAWIQATKGMTQQQPTAFTPQGQLPEDVPDPVSQIAAQLWGLIQQFGSQGAPAMGGPPPGGGQQPMPPGTMNHLVPPNGAQSALTQAVQQGQSGRPPY